MIASHAVSSANQCQSVNICMILYLYNAIFKYVIIIRLEARLPPNIGFSLLGTLAVLTRSVITPLKVKRFGWNLKHFEHIVGGWPWHILGAVRAIETVWEAGEILFFGPLNNARFHRFPVGQILRHLNTTTSIGVAIKTFGTEFRKF